MTTVLQVRRLTGVLLLVAGGVGVGCGGSSDAVDGRVTVLAAASLTEAFTDIGDAFMADHPDTTVTFNFAGSSELATQLTEGAPADVFASADLAHMARLGGIGVVGDELVVFARNRPEIVVAPGNPLAIAGLDDLTDSDLVVVTCAPQVPCGEYATAVFERAGVAVTPDSHEANVKSVVTKVALGEADAGIAYATDVVADDDRIDGVGIPDDVNVLAEYPIAVTADASDAVRAQLFVDFVRGDAGQAILADHGFTST